MQNENELTLYAATSKDPIGDLNDKPNDKSDFYLTLRAIPIISNFKSQNTQAQAQAGIPTVRFYKKINEAWEYQDLSTLEQGKKSLFDAWYKKNAHPLCSVEVANEILLQARLTTMYEHLHEEYKTNWTINLTPYENDLPTFAFLPSVSGLYESATQNIQTNQPGHQLIQAIKLAAHACVLGQSKAIVDYLNKNLTPNLLTEAVLNQFLYDNTCDIETFQAMAVFLFEQLTNENKKALAKALLNLPDDLKIAKEYCTKLFTHLGRNDDQTVKLNLGNFALQYADAGVVKDFISKLHSKAFETIEKTLVLREYASITIEHTESYLYTFLKDAAIPAFASDTENSTPLDEREDGTPLPRKLFINTKQLFEKYPDAIALPPLFFKLSNTYLTCIPGIIKNKEANNDGLIRETFNAAPAITSLAATWLSNQLLEYPPLLQTVLLDLSSPFKKSHAQVRVNQQQHQSILNPKTNLLETSIKNTYHANLNLLDLLLETKLTFEFVRQLKKLQDYFENESLDKAKYKRTDKTTRKLNLLFTTLFLMRSISDTEKLVALLEVLNDNKLFVSHKLENLKTPEKSASLFGKLKTFAKEAAGNIAQGVQEDSEFLKTYAFWVKTTMQELNGLYKKNDTAAAILKNISIHSINFENDTSNQRADVVFKAYEALIGDINFDEFTAPQIMTLMEFTNYLLAIQLGFEDANSERVENYVSLMQDIKITKNNKKGFGLLQSELQNKNFDKIHHQFGEQDIASIDKDEKLKSTALALCEKFLALPKENKHQAENNNNNTNRQYF